MCPFCRSRAVNTYVAQVKVTFWQRLLGLSEAQVREQQGNPRVICPSCLHPVQRFFECGSCGRAWCGSCPQLVLVVW